MSVKAIRFPKLRRLSGDSAYVAAGLVLATGTAVFAGHMILRNTGLPSVNGVEHLGVFSMPSTAPAASRAAARYQAPPRNEPAPAPEPLDMTPIGALPAVPQTPRAPEEPLAAYRLRAYRQGQALVSGPDGFISARVGEIVPGLGRVLAVEPRGRKLALVTEAGVILDD